MIEWTDDLNIGNTIIDGQHATLISISQELSGITDKKENNHIIEKKLDELMEYCKYHFDEEQKLMQKINYPNLNEHIHSHDNFTRKMNEFFAKFISGDYNILKELQSYLENWIIMHIKEEDTALKDYI